MAKQVDKGGLIPGVADAQDNRCPISGITVTACGTQVFRPVFLHDYDMPRDGQTGN